MPPKKNTVENQIKKKNKESVDNILKMLQQEKNDSGDKTSEQIAMSEDLGSTSNGNRTEKKAKPSTLSKTRKESKELKDPSPKVAASSSKITKSKQPSKSESGENSAEKKNSAGKGSSASTKTFRYEIDCGQVKDSVDVKDLQRFVTEKIKVNGRKNNGEDAVAVCCIGDSVVITSKVYLPKKSLRYLSKNFLKKKWNIRVKSKKKNSYEFVYIGTL